MPEAAGPAAMAPADRAGGKAPACGHHRAATSAPAASPARRA